MNQEPYEKNGRNLEETLKSLDDIREETGQISELLTEENMLVAEFLAALLKIMQPLAKTLPISTSILPEEWGKVNKVSLDSTGQLLVLYPDERMRLINLKEQRHRELLLRVTYDIIPTLKKLITLHRQKIETRVKFMSSIIKELQKTAKTFSLEEPKQ
jgi:hypothetical protein